MIDRPMNPYATEDFENAIKEATENFGKNLGKIGEQIQKSAEIPFVDFADMGEEYSGVMRLDYVGGLGAWQDVVSTLIAHGYEVSARIENATETERELDKVEKWIVIAFEECE